MNRAMNAAECALLWRWLAGVFAAPPEAAALATLREQLGTLEATARKARLERGLRQMRDALGTLPPGDAGVATLSHRFALLFSGAGGTQSVVPYESAFTSPTGKLFGEAEAHMRSLLAELDLHVADEVAEPADHIAVELAVMAELTTTGGVARDRLARALHGWLGAFRDACIARDRTRFYAGAAMVAGDLAEYAIGIVPAGNDNDRLEEAHEPNRLA
jgi:TorA-specific chaperone